MPASRSARVMTLAPRSWPSRPGLATSTRIGRVAGFSASGMVLLVAGDDEVRHPEKSPLVVGLRQPGDGRAGYFRVLEGGVKSVLHGPVPVQDLKHLLVAGPLEA